MNQLTISESQSVILFHDKSKKILPTVKAELLFQLSNKQEQFILDGGIYKFSAIAKIIPIEEYYQQYPSERPTVYSSNIEITIDELVDELPGDRRIRAHEGMLKGLDQFIVEKKGVINKGTADLRKKMVEKLELAKQE